MITGKFRTIVAAAMGWAVLPLPAATVGLVSYSEAGGPVLFETASGVALSGGTMFAGTFASPPSPGVSLADVIRDFAVFDSLDSASSAIGYFSGTAFTGSLGSAFPRAKIYLLVTDTASIAAATEFAVFGSTSATWTFPASEFAGQPTISLIGTVDQYFAGGAGTITDPGGIVGTFHSIRLERTAPPVPLVAPEIHAVLVSGHPGIEFAYPTAQAGSVTFTLQSSETLASGSFADVTAPPVTLSDDGTTRVLRILHPDLVSSQAERFFRLQVTAL